MTKIADTTFFYCAQKLVRVRRRLNTSGVIHIARCLMQQQVCLSVQTSVHLGGVFALDRIAPHLTVLFRLF